MRQPLATFARLHYVLRIGRGRNLEMITVNRDSMSRRRDFGWITRQRGAAKEFGQSMLARRLADALAAEAHSAIADIRTPRPSYGHLAMTRRSARRLTLVTIIAVAVALVAACSSSGSSPASKAPATPDTTPVAVTSSAQSSPTTSVPSTSKPVAAPSTSKATGAPVHIQLHYGDGVRLGIGIPVIAFFSANITDARALQAATTVKVNGQRVSGGSWYFEPVSGHPGFPLEGDYRLRNPWPGHSSIFVDIPAQGLSAGTGLVFDDSLTWSFSTGAANVATVDDRTHRLTLVTDGKVEGSYPVSLGANDTPTARGIKVIMEKGRDISMRGPGYFDPHVEFTQRLTYGGEYLHSAPWNTYNIDHGVNSSNGCTNLHPDAAEKLYGLLEVGDIVKYPNASGPAMTMGAGYGDWNIPWSQWLTGGDVQKI